jgi:hypothetical protein
MGTDPETRLLSSIVEHLDMADKEKSLPDGVEKQPSPSLGVTKEGGGLFGHIPPQSLRGIVGACPTCGCPIYGYHLVGADKDPKETVSKSCSC